MSSTFFHEDFFMKIFIPPSFLFCEFSSYQLMAKECICILSSGKLLPAGLPRNSVVRIIDRPDMTTAIYHGCEATNQKEKQTNKCAGFVRID